MIFLFDIQLRNKYDDDDDCTYTNSSL